MPKTDDVKKLVHKYIDDQFDSMSDTDLQRLAGGIQTTRPQESDGGPSEESFQRWIANNGDLVKNLQARLGKQR